MTSEVEQTNQTPEEQPSQGTGPESKPESPEFKEELNRLVESFTRAVRAAWNSEQRRQIESQLQSGLRTLVEEVEESLKRLQESEEGRELRERAEKMVARVRTSKVTAEIQEGLVKGLHTLAEELQELAERLEAQQRAEGKAEETPTASSDAEEDGPPAQDIPVSQS